VRYLNRVVFINSAAIRYADIGLDGNIHFIGTQGVGKSTVLRAILFFYNADTQKLGISKEKKLFSEYYFPFANSYIVYEVVRETGSFCVMAFKSQGRVCFRFLDGGFDRDHYLGEEGKAFESWDKIRSVLDRHRIDYTRKIDRYEEYRDILYGNNDGKRDFRKYALLESRQYQNIARTIQNVFLNSRLEADFIKQTIIRSLSEEDVQINLQTYQYELEGFEEQLADIQQFRQSTRQADSIANLHGIIRHMDRGKMDLSRRLAWALDQTRSREPLLAAALEEGEKRKALTLEKISDTQKRFTAKKEKIQAEITILSNQLKIAREKIEHYRKINISEVISRVSRKGALEREAADLNQEIELLTARYREITQKFEALGKEIDNQLAQFENSNERQRLKAESDFLEAREYIKGHFEKLIGQIEKQHDAKLRESEEACEQRAFELQHLREKKAEFRNKRFYEEETDQKKTLIAGLKGSFQEAENRIKLLKGEAETFRKQRETEEKSRTESYERQKERLEEKIAFLNRQIADIELKLLNSKESFYGWLNDQYPGWEKTIGKVCDENILFHCGLSPELLLQDRDAFYGVRIDLPEIERTVKTVADYEREKENVLSVVETTMGQMDDLSARHSDDLEKLKKKYNAKLRENLEQQRMSEYLLNQAAEKLKAEDLALRELVEKAGKEKKEALEKLDSQIALAAEAELETKEAVARTKEEIKKQTNAKEREKNNKIQEELAKKSEIVAILSRELDQYLEKHRTRKTELEDRKQAELSDKGADAPRIKEIGDRLAVISAELKYVEENQEQVFGYTKDKREFIDRMDEFKHQRQLQEQQLEQEEQKFRNQKHMLDEELKGIEQEIRSHTESLDKVREDLAEYETFRQLAWFESIGEFLKDVNPEYLTAAPCKELISEIKEARYAILERSKELREAINKFLGHFSAGNIFNFRTDLITDKEYLQFSDELSRFIEDDRISEYERRINERYAEIIKLIGKETAELISREGEIQGVIGKINRDITEKNFVGVIQKIELKLDESANRVVQILKMIKKFNDESGLMLGVANLFSGGDQDSINKKAVDLLRQLVKEIIENKRDFISLSDSFDLKFRVIENQNDSGWVERLSNVGSEGTDILVKAMMNIMLLNVFKEGASKRFKDFKLHCIMDEIGRLHPGNVRGILKFANDRNIRLINGSPTEHDALAYRHIYKLEKDRESITKVKRIITQDSQT